MALNARRGYHFKVSSQPCVACHKEHLGRDAQTILFDRKTFDHSLTGFARTGKHASIACEDCHARKNLKDPQVLKLVNETGRQTFLGLGQACAACHADRHNNTVGQECQNCHTTKAWAPAASFDHARTRFKLVGKHATVVCSKCHSDLELKEKTRPILFGTKAYSECTPCHLSPHNANFVGTQTCTSCHSEEDWKTARKASKFNHDLTAFRLLGKHASVACEKCHKSAAGGQRAASMKLAHNTCSDCHADYHRGDFAGKYNGDCAACHTPSGFQPSTFTLAAHAAARLALTGAHAATPCAKCHVQGADGRRVFRFAAVHCESCHQDHHGGQFRNLMAGQSCAACHSTREWHQTSFDHSKTNFALLGKHAQTRCDGCHKVKVAGREAIVQYKGVETRCESCHAEVHEKQFAVNGATDCAACHQPQGWHALVFDHEKQSTFALTGAHKRVECRQCHREERRGERTFVRFKPMSTKCESCHAQGSIGNG